MEDPDVSHWLFEADELIDQLFPLYQAISQWPERKQVNLFVLKAHSDGKNL